MLGVCVCVGGGVRALRCGLLLFYFIDSVCFIFFLFPHTHTHRQTHTGGHSNRHDNAKGNKTYSPHQTSLNQASQPASQPAPYPYLPRVPLSGETKREKERETEHLLRIYMVNGICQRRRRSPERNISYRPSVVKSNFLGRGRRVMPFRRLRV